MAICNLFKKLSNNTGEFLMFSQFTEDLTKNNSQGYKYRVVPSRFIAADIDFKNFKYGKGDLNVDFPTYLQNYFENGCAVCKNNPIIEWTPVTSANLFWNAMINGGLINIASSSNTNLKQYVKEFRCIEEINIQSYDVMDGMGYSEIYCYIPNATHSTQYGCSPVKENTGYIISAEKIVEGYNSEDFQENMLDWNISSGHKYFFEKSVEFQFDKNDYNYEILNDDKFNINCIIILYDINSSDDEGNIINLYKNIPLGLYLPGSFEGTDVKNTVTKWVKNSDIYDSGTSYGVRLCSRFSATSNYDTIKTTEVYSVDSAEYSSLCQVMGGVADNLNKMMGIVKDTVFESNSLKETLAMFKNSRTNVPYPVELYGSNYWFVNGRNTGIRIPDGTAYAAYNEDDIKNALISWDGVDTALLLNIYTIDKQGNLSYTEKIYPGDEQPATDILVRWDLINKYTLESVSVDKLQLKYPDETIVDLDPKVQVFTIKNVTRDNRYELKTIWAMEIDNEITENEMVSILDFKFCYPLYFGLVLGNIDLSGEDNSNSLIQSIISGEMDIQSVTGINKYVFPTQYNRVHFTSNGGRIVYAYPKEYGKLDKIINLNSMDNCISDFIDTNAKPDTIKVNLGNHSVDYYLYYTSNSTGAGIETIFEFADKERQINNSFIY